MEEDTPQPAEEDQVLDHTGEVQGGYAGQISAAGWRKQSGGRKQEGMHGNHSVLGIGRLNLNGNVNECFSIQWENSEKKADVLRLLESEAENNKNAFEKKSICFWSINKTLGIF